MLKHSLQQFVPPIIWNRLVLANNSFKRTNKTVGATIGPDTDIKGKIDKRASRSIISLGSGCLIEGELITETDDSQLLIRNNVFIGGGTIVDCTYSITIDDDVLISYRCIISDSDNHSTSYSVRKRDLVDWKQGKHDWNTTKRAAVTIQRGAWIGAASIILKGVVIGEGAIVGAGSVVTADIPAWTIAAGNPVRLIREIPEAER